MTGAGTITGVWLTTKRTGLDSRLVLPVLSVWSAVTVCGPSASAVVVQDQVPAEPTVALQTGEPLSRTVTFAVGSPVPETVGVVVATADPSDGDVTTGARGCPVTMVNETGADVGLVLPAVSTWLAVTVCRPSADGAAGVQDQLPAAATSAVHSGVAPSSTLTVALATPLPEKVG